jgi:hypothetical protein
LDRHNDSKSMIVTPKRRYYEGPYRAKITELA